MRIRLPANGWHPRDYQLPLWAYLESGGKRAVCVWHRRAGKDENCLHWTAVAAHERIGNYWHMLPEAAQARKAIWNAVNQKTGLRRIDEAFPLELRKRTLDNEMMIEFKNGSTWQVVGSDNYNSLVGSNPIGIIFSEFSVANPASWAYLRPILLENGGWAFFIYTARGKNHGYSLLESAKKSPGWFHQVLPVTQTGVFTEEDLDEELAQLQREHGKEQGKAIYEQEYLCSFEAQNIGAVYGQWMRQATDEGRIGIVPIEPGAPVNTAWDLGYDDSTSIWFWQNLRGEIRFIDYYENNLEDPAHYFQLLYDKGYNYGKHWGPHDAANKLLQAGGRSIIDQARDFIANDGTKWPIHMFSVPATSPENGINAFRKTLERSWFNEETCKQGIEALRSYHFKWDDELKIMSKLPVHDWSSHAADAGEIVGQVWREIKDKPEPPKPKFLHEIPSKDIFWPASGSSSHRERI